VARAGKSEEDCAAEGVPFETGRCELGTTPRGIIAGQEGLLKLLFHGGTGVLLGVHAICEIASEITGTGQAMIHNQATIEDLVRMAYTPRPTPTATSWQPPIPWPGCTPTYCEPCACRPGPTGSEKAEAGARMDLETLNATFVIATFLLLLTGAGPNSRWCPSSKRPGCCTFGEGAQDRGKESLMATVGAARS
jgi:hypothetical protein